MKIIDLTCPLDLDYALPLHLFKLDSYEWHITRTVRRDGRMNSRLMMSSHCATHLDAPMHVFERSEKAGIFSIDEWPLQQLYGDTVVLDIPKEELGEITADDLEKASPKVREGDIVLVHTGWGRFYVEDRKSPTYLTERRPGFVPSAAEWLVKKKVKALGHDLLVTNHPKYQFVPTAEERARGAIIGDEPVHRALLGNDIAVIEQLTNLDKIKGRRVTAGFFPLAIKGLDGSPIRALAFVD
ncbi:MAG: cyclase family protein [Chloroflexi bacterium]|nr:cyclase family protein [Chloroflexota bacterium]